MRSKPKVAIAVLVRQLAVIPTKALGASVGELRSRRAELVAALDLLCARI